MPGIRGRKKKSCGRRRGRKLNGWRQNVKKLRERRGSNWSSRELKRRHGPSSRDRRKNAYG